MDKNQIRPSVFASFSPFPGTEFDSTLASKLKKTGAQVMQLGKSSAMLAIWGTSKLSYSIDSKGVAIILIGEPQWSGPTGKEQGANANIAALLANAYSERGQSSVEYLSGNFSLTLIDTINDKAILAVDRIGIESLFYGTTGDGSIALASDMDLLSTYSSISIELDPQSIYDYTYFHCVPSPKTIFAGISKLPPAHCLVYEKYEAILTRYWRPTFLEQFDIGPRQLENELLVALKNAVSRCSVNGAVGGFLSGGLDSSAICGLLQAFTPEQVSAFTVGFDEKGYDEVYFARIAADHFELQHHIHYLTPEEVARSIPIIAEAYPEPFGNSSVVPTYICASVARSKGISVLLAGDGGDELFGGNLRYAKQMLFENYFRIPRMLRAGLLEPITRLQSMNLFAKPLRKLTRYVAQAKIPLPERLQRFNLLEMSGKREVFLSDFLDSVDTEHPRSLLRDEYFSVDDAHPINRMLMTDWRFTLADNDLVKVKHACALADIKVKFPFLDNDVLDLSLRIPASQKIRGQKVRYFYRQALRAFLPQEILKKPKHGFGLPFGEWLRQSDLLQDMVYSALSDLRKRGIFQSDFIDALIRDHRTQHAAFFGSFVWVLAMLEWWLVAHDEVRYIHKRAT